MCSRLGQLVVYLFIALCAAAPALAEPDFSDLFLKDTPDPFRPEPIKLDRRDDHEDDKRMDQQDADDGRAQLRKAWNEDFVDTDFSKPTFEDLVNLRGNDIVSGMRDWRKDGIRKDEVAEDKDEEKRRDDEKKRVLKDDKRDFEELTLPVPGMLRDWVPAKPDPIHNGGFALGADNGYPVPYKLNGWVDIQRKLPWEAEP